MISVSFLAWSSSLSNLNCTLQFLFLSSVIQSCLTLRPHGHQASLSIANCRSILRLISIKSMPSNHLTLCLPLLPPSTFPSIRVFSNESALHIRWPNYWNFSFTISPSNEYSGLISVRMDWLDLFAVQETLKGLLQHHSSKDIYIIHFEELPNGKLVVATHVFNIVAFPHTCL